MLIVNERPEKVLIIACGALAKETLQVIKLNNLNNMKVQCLPAKYHHRPQLIPEAIRQKIIKYRHDFDKIYVLYGDCGTAGALDKVLEEEGGIERIAGPHCFSFFMGNQQFTDNHADDPTVFYLTDFFCIHFEKFVWQALGLNKHRNMVELVFGNYTKLLFISQTGDSKLNKSAQAIAERLGLQYEYKHSRYADVETELIRIS